MASKRKFDELLNELLLAEIPTLVDDDDTSPFLHRIIASMLKKLRQVQTPVQIQFYSNESKLMLGRESWVGHAVLKKAFNHCYKNQDIFNKSLVLLQSPGYGKSKSCLDFAKEARCVFLPCCTIDNKMNQPEIVRRFIGDLKGVQGEAKFKVALKFITAIYDATKQYQAPDELYNGQFITADVYNQIAAEYVTFGITLETLTAALTPSAVSSTTSASTEAEIVEPTIVGDEAEQETRPLILIFEEAMVLGDGIPADTLSKYSSMRCIQRAVNNTPNVFAIFLSTTSQVTFLHPRYGGSMSFPSSNLVDLPPIIDFIFVDQYKDHLFVLGRPLWYNYLTQSCASNYNALMDFALGCIAGGCGKTYRALISSKSDKQLSPLELRRFLCAIICCRLQFHPISAYTVYDSNDLLAFNMATAISITQNDKVVCKYLSEPILCEAAARATIEGLVSMSSVMTEMLDASKTRRNNPLIEPPKDDKGEFVGAAALLYSMDEIRKKRFKDEGLQYDPSNVDLSYSCPVSAANFIRSLLEHESVLQDNNIDLTYLDDFTVNFTHFVRPRCISDNQIIELNNRHAAAILTAGCTDVDLLIIMTKQSTTGNTTQVMSKETEEKSDDIDYGGIVIQVKNHALKISLHSSQNLLRGCTLNAMYNCSIFTSTAFVSVLLSVGGEVHIGESSVEIFQEMKQFPFYETKGKGVTKSKVLQMTLDLRKSFHMLTTDVKQSLHSMVSHRQRGETEQLNGHIEIDELAPQRREYGTSGVIDE